MHLFKRTNISTNAQLVYIILISLTLINLSLTTTSISLIILLVAILNLIHHFKANKKDISYMKEILKSGSQILRIRFPYSIFEIILVGISVVVIFESYTKLGFYNILLSFAFYYLTISLDFFQRYRSFNYCFIINNDEIILWDSVLRRISYEEISRIVLTSNKKEIWIDWGKKSLIFYLRRFNNDDKIKFLRLLKRISDNYKIQINENLANFS